MKSSHIPELAGAIETITGEIVVDTGLRDIQTFVATFKSTNFVPDQESLLSWYPLPNGQPGQMVIRVEKGGVNHGLIGTNPVNVSWMALGR
jgi:hypothetical protein